MKPLERTKRAHQLANLTNVLVSLLHLGSTEGVSEIVKLTSMPEQTVRDNLAELEAMGYVEINREPYAWVYSASDFGMRHHVRSHEALADFYLPHP